MHIGRKSHQPHCFPGRLENCPGGDALADNGRLRQELRQLRARRLGQMPINSPLGCLDEDTEIDCLVAWHQVPLGRKP